RRLWSGVDSVASPRPGVWGGPFVLAGSTAGLEVVLRRNDRWFGGGPFLDEVRLVLVPDPITARQLLASGELDVIAPLASTNRTAQLRAIDGVRVSVGRATSTGGWWVGLFFPGSHLSTADRRGVVATVDRSLFVGTLLRAEASVL